MILLQTSVLDSNPLFLLHLFEPQLTFEVFAFLIKERANSMQSQVSFHRPSILILVLIAPAWTHQNISETHGYEN